MFQTTLRSLSGASLLATALVQAGTLDTLPPYPGWSETRLITNKNDGKTEFYEIIRMADNPKSPAEFLTINVFPATVLKPEAGPSALLTFMSLGVHSACEKTKVAPANNVIETDYKVSYAQFYCSKQKGKDYGVINLQKAIKGEKSIYIIQREWRVKPFEFENEQKNSFTISTNSFGSETDALKFLEALKIANEYLSNTTLCRKDGVEGICGK